MKNGIVFVVFTLFFAVVLLLALSFQQDAHADSLKGRYGKVIYHYELEDSASVLLDSTEGSVKHYGCSWIKTQNIFAPVQGDLLFFECKWNDSPFSKVFFLWDGVKPLRLSLEDSLAVRTDGTTYGICYTNDFAADSVNSPLKVRYLEIHEPLTRQSAIQLATTFPNVTLINVCTPCDGKVLAELVNSLSVAYVHWGFRDTFELPFMEVDDALSHLRTAPEPHASCIEQFMLAASYNYSPKYLSIEHFTPELSEAYLHHADNLLGLVCRDEVPPDVILQILKANPGLRGLMVYQPTDFWPLVKQMEAMELRYVRCMSSGPVKICLPYAVSLATNIEYLFGRNVSILDLSFIDIYWAYDLARRTPELRRIQLELFGFNKPPYWAGTPEEQLEAFYEPKPTKLKSVTSEFLFVFIDDAPWLSNVLKYLDVKRLYFFEVNGDIKRFSNVIQDPNIEVLKFTTGRDLIEVLTYLQPDDGYEFLLFSPFLDYLGSVAPKIRAKQAVVITDNPLQRKPIGIEQYREVIYKGHSKNYFEDGEQPYWMFEPFARMELAKHLTAITEAEKD